MSLPTNNYKIKFADPETLSRDCWRDNELLALCIVDREEKIARVYHTRSYDGEFERYFKLVERSGIGKFEFNKVSEEEILQLRSSL